MEVDNSLVDSLRANNQDHLLRYWNDLDLKQQALLTKDIKAINLEELNGFANRALSPPTENGHSNIDDLMKPIPQENLGCATNPNDENVKRWQAHGLEEISNGRIAVILLAGGQGTRLGVKYPKGMYDVSLPSRKTLYQLQAERIRSVECHAEQVTGQKGSIVWYIMTSEATKKETADYFKDHNYFGMQESNVEIFEQFTLPCIDFNKKIILKEKHRVASAPDGNGGLYRALRERGILKNMMKRGVQACHVYCVDNILVKMADPVFIGFCKEKNADCGAKVVEKMHPDEAVGVVCSVDGVYQVVEYSEISKETARKQSSGKLTFSAGNICNHYFTIDFLKKVCSPENEKELHHHIAKKKIPHLDSAGDIITPEKPNGVKMEKFVFDVFKFSERFAVLEVERRDEFSPLKNADVPGGNSNPRTSRWALMHFHHRLIASAGGRVKNDEGKFVTPDDGFKSEGQEYPVKVEISPLVSYCGEGLSKFVNGKELSSPVHLE